MRPRHRCRDYGCCYVRARWIDRRGHHHVQYSAGRHARNVFLPAAVSGLPKDSVINVTALITLDKSPVCGR
jgi:hypothetical protein